MDTGRSSNIPGQSEAKTIPLMAIKKDLVNNSERDWFGGGWVGSSFRAEPHGQLPIRLGKLFGNTDASRRQLIDLGQQEMIRPGAANKMRIT